MILHLDNDLQLIKDIRQSKKDNNQIVATTNGVFDILHIGHINMLKEAKSLCDYLIVGLNSDSSTRKNKGSLRPIISQNERAEIIKSIRYVDLVIIFEEPECIRFVREISPDIHVNDESYGEFPIEYNTVVGCGGKLHIVKRTNSSTTNIIEKIIRSYLPI